MLVTKSASPLDTGPQGMKLAAAAERLESVLWGQVLSSMTRTAMSGSALGTGSQLYNGIATHALASSMFSKTDSTLTQEIVDQLKTELSSDGKRGLASLGSAVGHNMPHGATISALAAMPQVQGTTFSDPSLVSRAVSYAKSIWPAIKASAASLDVPPVALLAQSALETGWGTSIPGNNLFGIKATAGQDSTVDPTHEDLGGVMQATTAAFAVYKSADAALSHYVSLIRNAYKDAIGSPSVVQYANALAQGGYATDANYAQKIIGIAQSPIMQSVLQAIEGASP